MAGIIGFSSPLALIYAFHARRKAMDRGFAWAAFVLALLVFVPFAFLIIGSALNLGVTLCR